MVDSVRRNGPYAPLSANYADDDRLVTLDIDEDDRAELLFLRALAYSARDLEAEGFISDTALRAGRILRRNRVRKVDSVLAAAERLVEVGLWLREDDGYRIASWLKWNKSWTELTRKRLTDAERKARVRADSTRTDDGLHAESATSPQDVAPPEALHVTTRHVTSDAATTTGSLLLDAFRETGAPLPRQTLRRLGEQIDQLINDGIDPDRIAAALDEWRRKPDAAPGLLPHLVRSRPAPKVADTDEWLMGS